MSKIKVTTYEQDRLYFFVDQVSLAQKKYNRLFKTFKDAPYLSEGARFLSDAGRELQFYKDVVEMLDKGYRKQSDVIDEFAERLKDYPIDNLEKSLQVSDIIDEIAMKMKGGAE